MQTVRDLVCEHRDIRSLLMANALWEFTLAALKSFIVLFLVVGLGQSLGVASLLIGVVAAASVVAAIVAGKLGDRHGIARVMRVALWIYGLGLLVPFFSQSPWLVAPVIPLIALGGAIVMTLPYGLLMGIMPSESHGAATGLYGFSRGLGVVLGPLLTGLAIDLMGPWLEGTQGYSAMFLVASTATLLSIPFLRTAIASARHPARGPAPEPRGQG
jgi:MFS family permease